MRPSSGGIRPPSRDLKGSWYRPEARCPPANRETPAFAGVTGRGVGEPEVPRSERSPRNGRAYFAPVTRTSPPASWPVGSLPEAVRRPARSSQCSTALVPFLAVL
jgi:hypothetical protein